MILSLPEILSRLSTLGIQGFLANVMAASVLTESGGDLQAVGDGGHSIGAYQLYDQGAGAGMSVEDREDFTLATEQMYPRFQESLRGGREHGLEGEDLATYVYINAERPYGWPSLSSQAADSFRDKWDLVLQQQEDPNPPEVSQDLRDRFIASLRQYFGVPYVFGGKDADGFDCSGLITYCARQVGFDLGDPALTNAEELRSRLEEIPDTLALEGDLLFFEHTYDTPGASHVGVSLGAGSHQMLDTHEPRGVGITDLGQYWQDHWLGVGRLPAVEAPVDDLATQLAAERAWGSALLTEIHRWRVALELAKSTRSWKSTQAVIDTMKRNEG